MLSAAGGTSREPDRKSGSILRCLTIIGRPTLMSDRSVRSSTTCCLMLRQAVPEGGVVDLRAENVVIDEVVQFISPGKYVRILNRAGKRLFLAHSPRRQ